MLHEILFTNYLLLMSPQVELQHGFKFTWPKVSCEVLSSSSSV